MQTGGTPFEVFQYRDYRYAQAGVFVSQISTQMLLIAINWHIYLITKSPLSLGIIGAARFIPTLAFSLFAGLAADTFNRKKLILCSQLVLVLTSLCLTVLTFSKSVSSSAIYALISINAVALVFSSPALQSILPHLVPRDHFIKAVSLHGIMWQLATIIGPAIGGFIIGLFGVGYVYLITVFLYFSLSVAIIIIKPLPKQANRPELNLRSIRQGMGFVKRTPLIWSTMLLDFFATFFASATTLMPIFAKDILNIGPEGLGILYAAPSVGAIIAGLIFSSLQSVKKQGKILLISVLLYGLATVIFGLSKVFVLSLLALCIAGAMDSISSIIRNTIRQLVTPDNLRGRMVSVTMIFYTGGPQLGEIEAGIAATIFGTPLSMVFGGIGTIAVTVIMAYIVPTLRRYDSHKQLG